ISVADDAGDIAGRRERSDAQRSVGVLQQLSFQGGGVDVTVCVLGNHHDVGDRLAPGQLVGVVFKGPDEHDGAFVGRDCVVKVVSVVQVRGNPQSQDADQLVDGS